MLARNGDEEKWQMKDDINQIFDDYDCEFVQNKMNVNDTSFEILIRTNSG